MRLNRKRGFTLVELLVVIAIIAILAALLLPVISKVQDQSKRKADRMMLQQLETALGMYEQAYQDYPPSTLDKLGLKGVNDINQGMEVLVAVLSSTRKGTPFYEFKEDQLCNTDEDKAQKPMSEITGGFKVPDLWELEDKFGNPFVYLHHRDYAKPEKATKYRLATGVDTTIVPQKSEKTKEWQCPGTFQMWSFGPDGENQNGAGDNVVSW